MFLVLAAWIALVLAGWLLVFASADGAVRSTATGEPADLASRAYFVGYTVFTLGNGDYRPGAGTWQLATVATTGTGLLLVTLAISYLVPVASAVAERRLLASYIHSLGGTAQETIARAWTGDGFGQLGQHLAAITPLVHNAREKHHTYPVLHYFHSIDPRSAAATNIVTLAETVHLLRDAVSPPARLDATTLGALDTAIERFLETLDDSYLAAAETPLDPPDLEPLRAAAIPVIDDDTYAAATSRTERHRRLLAAVLTDDGWMNRQGAPTR